MQHHQGILLLILFLLVVGGIVDGRLAMRGDQAARIPNANGQPTATSWIHTMIDETVDELAVDYFQLEARLLVDARSDLCSALLNVAPGTLFATLRAFDYEQVVEDLAKLDYGAEVFKRLPHETRQLFVGAFFIERCVRESFKQSVRAAYTKRVSNMDV